ncbi:MAG: hypothetical protein MUE40_12715 [Anaerolineae bacterium]|nr:hypothetical protein [Anaerolineae bacterium]
MMALLWHGFPAWQMENDRLRVVVVPALGAKIAELLDKPAGYAWLAGPTHPVRERHYGDAFVAHDLAGWDEMFPTINACPSPHAPDVMLPDHGEVWALPWEQVPAAGDALVLRVRGRALPYTLTRTLALHEDGLRLTYHLENTGGQPLPYLWAAHPLFRVAQSCTVELPAGVPQVINAAAHPRLGPPDTPLAWSAALATVGPPQRRDYRKVYLPPAQPLTGACVREDATGARLCLSWDGRDVPYLGIWMDEGTYTRESTVALEPATGYYDSLSLAIQHRRVAVVPAGGSAQWWLALRLLPGGAV